MMNPMRILVHLVLNWKFLEIISRYCATLSAIGCMYHDMSSWHEFRPWVREVNMYICNRNVCITMYAALQTSCNPSGVEPIHWKPTDIDPGSLIYGTNWKVGSFRLKGTNQTNGCIRGRKVTTKKRLGRYGGAGISRLLKIIGLFCKIALWKRLCSAKETYNLKEPTYRSHPICTYTCTHTNMHRIYARVI